MAKTLAELEKAVLHVVHVGEPILPPREVLRKLGLTSEQLRGSVIDQAVGAPAEGIVRLARDLHCLFIVMCKHTGMVEPSGELGPVAEETLRLSPLLCAHSQEVNDQTAIIEAPHFLSISLRYSPINIVAGYKTSSSVRACKINRSANCAYSIFSSFLATSTRFLSAATTALCSSSI